MTETHGSCVDAPETRLPDTPTAGRRERLTLDLMIGSVSVSLSMMQREGPKSPIVFLHGFGSTKEDFADVDMYEGFEGHAFYAYDAPGFGRTRCGDPGAVDMGFLVESAARIAAQYVRQPFHLVGHSMGGLTALLFADRVPDQVLSFTNIEGNLAPEDCFLSRQVMHRRADTLFADLIDRTWHARDFALALYAERIRHNACAEAAASIFRSMVWHSDQGQLLDRFIALRAPKLFMYGASNRSLSYLDRLREAGVDLCEVPLSGHFPMYSNPPAMWQALARFIGKTEASRHHARA